MWPLYQITCDGLRKLLLVDIGSLVETQLAVRQFVCWPVHSKCDGYRIVDRRRMRIIDVVITTLRRAAVADIGRVW